MGKNTLYSLIFVTLVVALMMNGSLWVGDCAIYYYNGEVNAVMARDFCEGDKKLDNYGCMLDISDPRASSFYSNYLKYHQGSCGRMNDDGRGEIIDKNNNNMCPNGHEFVPVHKTETGVNGYIHCKESK